ncbi:sodium- and chloride-dependent GABA transporter 1-like isoform X2 [Xenia sp. Carnegie-2017]|uniref:sodium- and chloride-dependent GABA transporter 1-like isoform X2 n=1 Tax=Xenia sp. Carnegie-2017 TaxID=2897299 RepID=UPI001F048A21|nr:sodium- and chloride-dependent GABA transporter 1-like isoform X2 [Xenia sp. Carnegie-2017]
MVLVSKEKCEGEVERERWTRKAEFLLACVGFAVGYGNFWRFPYMCFKNGGGAFLIPYLLCLILAGIPVFMMEMTIGQILQTNAIKAWKRICPLFGGIGYANMVISFMVSVYYNIILAWSCYYFFNSFKSNLPWVGCNNKWNEDCFISNKSNHNTSRVSSSREFYVKKVLQLTHGIDTPGNINWEMFGCLLLAWTLVYFCIWKGIRTTGKVVYVTATVPYLILLILFFRGVTLDGAGDGVLYYVKPRLHSLMDLKVWVDAASQIMYSLAIGLGVILGFSSYNNRNNTTLYRDAVLISIVNCGTSIFAGFVIFSVVGNMAMLQGKSVEDVASQGPGLVFIVYPEALSKLPIPQFWSVIFFFMLITLGLDSQFGQVEVICSAIIEKYPQKLHRYKEIIVFTVCFVEFLLGISCITQGGVYVFNLLDSFAAGVCLLFVVIFELFVMAWVFGGRRWINVIYNLTGTRIHSWWLICWKYISLILVATVFFFNLIKYPEKGITYETTYRYPVWAEVLGWCIAALPMVCIPAYAMLKILQTSGTIKERISYLMQPKVNFNEIELQVASSPQALLHSDQVVR